MNVLILELRGQEENGQGSDAGGMWGPITYKHVFFISYLLKNSFNSFY